MTRQTTAAIRHQYQLSGHEADGGNETLCPIIKGHLQLMELWMLRARKREN